MNKINDLLKQYQHYFDFDESDYAFYEEFANKASKEEFAKKYQYFIDVFKSFEKQLSSHDQKIEYAKKGVIRQQEIENNKNLRKNVYDLKQEGFTREAICKKLRIDEKKLISLEVRQYHLNQNK